MEKLSIGALNFRALYCVITFETILIVQEKILEKFEPMNNDIEKFTFRYFINFDIYPKEFFLSKRVHFAINLSSIKTKKKLNKRREKLK